MLQTRVMPCLLLQNSKLVKTIKFKNPNYVGDPVNAIKIYNEKEVDELIFLDITATIDNKKPSFKTISEIASECFMPLTYGGGINNLDDMRTIFNLGVEKIAINSYGVENPSFIVKASEKFGSQSIIVSIDVKKKLVGSYDIYTHSGTKNAHIDPIDWAKKVQDLGAGEILLTSIDRDGTMEGYDLPLINKICDAVSIPVIVCGGAGKVEDFAKAVHAGASAVAAGSLVVYHGSVQGVLINFPSIDELKRYGLKE
jgi:imidazole glycerol-phosphate synthase subunit HisF